jgi:hypothetical protein
MLANTGRRIETSETFMGGPAGVLRYYAKGRPEIQQLDRVRPHRVD